MEFKYTENILYNITLALADDRVRCIVHTPTQTLMLVKDFMHGAPLLTQTKQERTKNI